MYGGDWRALAWGIMTLGKRPVLPFSLPMMEKSACTRDRGPFLGVFCMELIRWPRIGSSARAVQRVPVRRQTRAGKIV